MNTTIPDLTPSKVYALPNREHALQAVLNEIAARRDEFGAISHIPRDVIGMMKQAGIFRASTPTHFGGDALPPHEFMRTVERISTIDGSAGWISAFGSANTYLATLPLASQEELYASGPDQVFAGGFFPPHPGKEVSGGWSVSGRWKFASGCKGADWLGVGFNKSPEQPGNISWAIFPSREVEIVESWDVVGMQGTGSHDLALNDKFISNEWTCERSGATPFDDTLYRYPALSYQAQIHAVVNLGLARAAIDIAIEMAEQSKLIPGVSKLAGRAYFKNALSRAEVCWQSARMYFYEVAEQAWACLAAGDELPRPLLNMLNLSAAHAAHTSADITQSIYRVSGIGVIQKTHRLQHIVRDSMVVTQHAAVSLGTFEAAGAVLANVDPGMPYI
ncbi:acyl-CoA dehydrogenase family protein [Paraburkholderia tropica]|uniref:acyl-CoA dehydrogenase family protein n=1 Tax=Paraburkholderia tropica TaxID=92647 RepID=UPI002AB30AA9|nr:acyl-CoA dehydrogenase family protein [Paraburkholderia tropica]